MEIIPTKKHLGCRELRKHQAGERLSAKGMILAKCAECMAGYHDTARDCKIPECPLYPLMPYREGGPMKLRDGSKSDATAAREQLRKNKTT